MLNLDHIKQRLPSRQAPDSDGVVSLPENPPAEADLQTEIQEEYLSWVIQSMSDSLVVIGPDGRIAAVNQATLKLLDYAEADLIGQSPGILFADGTFRGSGLETLHERGIVQRGEKILRTRAGRQIPVYYSGSVLRNAEGRVRGIVCVMLDVTKQKQTEASLREALRKEHELLQLKSQFIATVSHEFRTPLTVIQMTNDMLRLYADHMDTTEKTKNFDQVQKQIRHMIRMLEDALTVEQMQSDAVEFHPEVVDMDRFCRALLGLFEGRVRRKFVYTCPEPCPPVAVDKGLMKQVVLHLLTNAIKFSGPDSPISMTLTCADQHLRLQIQDQGLGVPAAEQERLFEPFFRGSNTGTIGGTGLGLTLAKHAVDIHKGTITIDSQVGAGTTITVAIPLN
jgi:two-component system, OmpR family, sensor histidine kinase VicK